MDKNFQEDSDYHTGSEYEQDFDSDNEPPVDKLIEKKMIHKGKDLRVYKRILRFGKRGFERPAAFDKINLKFGYVQNEIELIKDLDEQCLEYKELQIGLGELGSQEFFKIAISTMKHQEVAFFEIEKLKFTEHKDRKLDERVYFVVEVFDWMTVIDFEGDQKIFKIVYNKGSGIHRVEKTDNLKMRVSLNDYKFQNFYDKQWEFQSYKEIESEFQEYLNEINFNGKKDIFEYCVTNMKNQDLVILEIDKQQFPKVQQKQQSKENIFFNQEKKSIYKNEVFYKTSDEYYYLVIDLQALTYFEDVFMDQSVIKEVKKNGYTTAKPEDLSKIFFDFNIIVNEQEIYTTFKERPQPNEDHEQKFYEKNNYFWEYLNEYKYSKALEGTLKFMKKFEECQITIKDLNKLQRGEDLEKIKNYLKQQNIELTQQNLNDKKVVIKYSIKLFYFKEGQNSFTIDLKQREQFIERRKVKAVEFLKSQQYKKALKLFHKIDNLAEYGVFDEDKQTMIPYRKSALLNISLIYWKMQNWPKMKTFAEKVLDLDPYNVKAVYRSAYSSFKLQDHEEALQKLQNFENFKNEEDLQVLYDKIRKDFQSFKQKTKQIFSKFKVDNQLKIILCQEQQNLIKRLK